ncbi:hypothetical protein Tco_1479288 [Tanacetum coccineum]
MVYWRSQNYQWEVQLHDLVDSKKIIIFEASVRRDLKLEDEEGMIRNLDNVSGKFVMYPRKHKRKDTQVPKPSDPSENVADEAVHKELGDSLVVVPGAKKPWGILLLKLGLRMYLNFLMIHCSQETKTTQANEIASLKRRVKKLEKKISSRTHKLKRLYKIGLTSKVESSGDKEDLGEDASKWGRRINAIDTDEDITLVNVQDNADC